MIIQMVSQLLLPLLMLAWLAFFPATHRLVYAVQLICVGLLLGDVAVVGMWLVLPWWVPYFYGVLFLLIVLRNSGVRNGQRKAKVGWISKAMLFLLVGLTTFASYLGFFALQGHRPADENMVDIALPFGSGTYLVAQGGSNRTVNDHYKTLDKSVPRFAAWRGQSKGLDIAKINAAGFRAKGLQPTDPAQYFSFGVDILAPCDGTVAAARDGLEDMQIPQTDRVNLLGNYVILECENFFVVMAHLKKASLLVKRGDDVAIGDRIGQLGNSGNSGEPHLHIHAQRDLPRDEMISGEPLALTIDGTFYARNDRFAVE